MDTRLKQDPLHLQIRAAGYKLNLEGYLRYLSLFPALHCANHSPAKCTPIRV